MATRYVERTYEDFEDVLVKGLGFKEIEYTGAHSRTFECVFEQPMATKKGVELPGIIRVYSTVCRRSRKTRDVGTDAIRVVMVDRETGKPIAAAESRVFRTKSAMENLVERCRDMYRHAMSNPTCKKCGAMTVPREIKRGNRAGEKFMGCIRWGITCGPKNGK